MTNIRVLKPSICIEIPVPCFASMLNRMIRKHGLPLLRLRHRFATILNRIILKQNSLYSLSPQGFATMLNTMIRKQIRNEKSKRKCFATMLNRMILKLVLNNLFCFQWSIALPSYRSFQLDN